MSDDARSALRRWGEPALAAAGAAFLLWTGLDWLDEGAPLGWVALVGALILALWLRAALASALAGRKGDAPGVVVLREGEIGYMGPTEGGFLPLAAIERVTILIDRRRQPVWLIEGGEMGTLVIPARARSGDRLVEALSVLPGFHDLEAGRLLSRAEPGRHVIWQRNAPHALAPI